MSSADREKWVDAPLPKATSRADFITNSVWSGWKNNRKISHGNPPALNWLSLKHLTEFIIKTDSTADAASIIDSLDPMQDYEENLDEVKRLMGYGKPQQAIKEIESERVPDINDFLASERLVLPNISDPNYEYHVMNVLSVLVSKLRDAEQHKGKVQLTIQDKPQYVNGAKITGMIEELTSQLRKSEEQRLALAEQLKTPPPPQPLPTPPQAATPSTLKKEWGTIKDGWLNGDYNQFTASLNKLKAAHIKAKV